LDLVIGQRPHDQFEANSVQPRYLRKYPQPKLQPRQVGQLKSLGHIFLISTLAPVLGWLRP
jgi:hypothetical protein